MATQNSSPSGWVGWAYFASFMLMVLGFLHALEGLTGIFKQSYYVVTQSHLIAFDFRAWGWVNLVMGIVIFVAGFELLRGSLWARVVAIVLAGLSIVANMAFMDAYPLWAILVIVIDILVIHALVVHGHELKQD